jgi:hypothetical protein
VARVLGPHWTKADKITLYVNGVPTKEVAIEPNTAGDLPRGVKWQGEWTLDRPEHDVFLSAVAVGPGIKALYWPTPKPYQPTSPDWTSYVMAVTGPIWIDGDGDGRFTSAFEYAEQLVKKTDGDFPLLVRALLHFDEAVAVQAASLLAAAGRSPLDDAPAAASLTAAPHTRRGFARYAEAWKASQQARLQP